jgi:hypothetical protein
MTIRIGLNAGFGDPLAGEFAGIATHGFSVVRQDVYAHQSSEDAAACVREFAGMPVTALFLIGGGKISHPNGNRLEPHELAPLVGLVVDTAAAAGVTGYAIEIGNEPDIACPGYADHPEDFAEAIRQCLEAARAHQCPGPLITGGIANLNDRGLRYLSRMLKAPSMPADGVTIGFHRYPEAGHGPLAPHDHFQSRDDEWAAFQQLVGTRPTACTEFGYHTAASHPQTLTDQNVAESVLWDLRFYDARQVGLACIYQLNDGPTDTWINRYGVRAQDGTWKPVAHAIQGLA